MNLTLVLSLAAVLVVSVETSRDRLQVFLDTNVDTWRFHKDPVDDAHDPDFDDRAWETVHIGHRWEPHDSTCWFRTAVIIPETIMGFPTRDRRIRMKVGMDNEAVAYVNGVEKQRFEWREGDIVLTEHAVPGEVIHVALHGINRPGFGALLHAYMGTDASVEIHAALKDWQDRVDIISTHLNENDDRWRDAINKAYDVIMIALDRGPSHSEASRKELLLHAVAEAERFMLACTDSAPSRLARLQSALPELDECLAAGVERKLSMDYVRQKARVIRSFIDYARDDFDAGTFWKMVRAERVVSYLETLLNAALSEARVILDDPARDRPVPRYKTGPVEIHSGAFWQNDRPVFLNGVGHFEQVRQDIPILQDYGFNIIQIEIGPNSVIREDGTIDLIPLETGILRYLQQADRENIAVCVLLSPHYMPQWAFELYPELADGGHGFIKYDIDHPAARDILERFIQAVVPKMAAYRSLHSFCLSNEPQYIGRSKWSGELFHTWLKQRYGTIDRLNTLYQSRFATFEDIPQATSDFPDPAYIDWCEFNQERFRAWHRWMAELIHEYAPHVPVHAKSMAHAWGGAEHFELGVNHEDFTRLGSITGNDCFVLPTWKKEYPYAQHWILQAMHYDFQRSAAPGNPIFNSENHIIPDDNPTFITDGHIYTALWQGAIHGMGASTIWVWERGEGKTLGDNILTRPTCVEAAGRAGLDLLRLAPFVARFANEKPSVGLFHAWHSFARSNDTRDASIAAYEGLSNLGVHIKIVTENAIQQGALDDLPLVVLAKTSNVHPETVPYFENYIRHGGTVVAIEPCFTSNQYGQPESKLSEWLPAGERSGQVIRLRTPVTARTVWDLAGERLKQLGRGTSVSLTDAYGDALWGVLWQVVDDGDRFIVNVVNMRRDSQSIRIPLQSRSTVNELISGEIHRREFVLPPLTPMLLEIKKDDLEELVVDRGLY